MPGLLQLLALVSWFATSVLFALGWVAFVGGVLAWRGRLGFARRAPGMRAWLAGLGVALAASALVDMESLGRVPSLVLLPGVALVALLDVMGIGGADTGLAGHMKDAASMLLAAAYWAVAFSGRAAMKARSAAAAPTLANQPVRPPRGTPSAVSRMDGGA